MSEATREMELKARVFDLQITVSAAQQQIEVILKELNEINKAKTVMPKKEEVLENVNDKGTVR